MDRTIRKKMESLDDFYLVEVIRDQTRFGYDDRTAAVARRILKKRGRSEAELEAIYSREVAPQDEAIAGRVLGLYEAFDRLGRLGMGLFLFSLVYGLFFLSHLHGLKPPRALFGLELLLSGLAVLQALLFILIPIVCVSRARRITRILLQRYDNSPSRDLLYRLDESAWLLLGWFLFTPGFIYSFLRTRRTLKRILAELGIVAEPLRQG